MLDFNALFKDNVQVEFYSEARNGWLPAAISGWSVSTIKDYNKNGWLRIKPEPKKLYMVVSTSPRYVVHYCFETKKLAEDYIKPWPNYALSIEEYIQVV